MTKKDERNYSIINSIKETRSLSETGNLFRLTASRISKILSEYNVSLDDIRNEHRKVKEEILEHRYNSYIKKFKKIPYAKEVEANRSDFKKFAELNKEARKAGFKAEYLGLRIGVPDLIINLCNLAIKLNKTPGVKIINKYGKYAHTTYYNEFGSLKKAQELAMLKPNKKGAPIGNTNGSGTKRKKTIK